MAHRRREERDKQKKTDEGPLLYQALYRHVIFTIRKDTATAAFENKGRFHDRTNMFCCEIYERRENTSHYFCGENVRCFPVSDPVNVQNTARFEYVQFNFI
jgi:hypothetical protein